MRTRRFLLFAALSLICSPALAADGHQHAHDGSHASDPAHEHEETGDGHHRVDAGGVTILHAWARATDDGSTEIFMELTNGSGSEVTLLGAHMHETGLEAIVMGAPVKAGDAPVELGPLPIAAGMEFDLDPDGVYLLLTGLTEPLTQGDMFALDLKLEPIGEVEITVDVEVENAMQHSHAGHMH